MYPVASLTSSKQSGKRWRADLQQARRPVAPTGMTAAMASRTAKFFAMTAILALRACGTIVMSFSLSYGVAQR